jgi:glycosyltransferase involved in cell wall biosynthesis
MAVYNGAATIGQALDTVYAQSYTDFDVLVLDDGSTDQSAEIASSYDCRVMKVKNGGLGEARRLLVEEARGELVAFIDHDDFWLEQKLKRQIDLLDRTGADLVHADCWYVHSDGEAVPRDLKLPACATSFDHILPNNWIIASSAVFNRQAMLDVGNFVPDTVRCSDWYGWLMLAPKHQFVHLPEKLVRYSVLDTSLANAGLKFYQAQHYLLTQHILPRREELFADVPADTKARYLRMLVRDVGLALSGMARAERKTGHRSLARKLAINAIRHAPDSTKVWSRALSCLAP